MGYNGAARGTKNSTSCDPESRASNITWGHSEIGSDKIKF